MTVYSKKVIIKLEKNKNKKMHILKSNNKYYKKNCIYKRKKAKKWKTNTLKFRFLFILRVSKLHKCLTLETLKYSNNFFIALYLHWTRE